MQFNSPFPSPSSSFSSFYSSVASSFTTPASSSLSAGPAQEFFCFLRNIRELCLSSCMGLGMRSKWLIFGAQGDLSLSFAFS